MSRCFGRYRGLRALCLLGVLVGCGVRGLELPAAAGQSLPIRVEQGDWGSARPVDIRAVLRSAAAQLVPHFECFNLPEIAVFPARGNPITLHARGPRQEVRIGLTARDRYWAQYAFQFGHELVHYLVGHLDTEKRWPIGSHGAGWFEESLCEAGSLFVLRGMAVQWQVTPPHPHWSDFSAALSTYAQQRMELPEHRLPGEQSFAEWYAVHRETLQAEPLQRARNAIVAQQLLPMLEAEPSGWRATAYLRSGEVDPAGPLEEVLPAWHDACPEDLRDFVLRFAEALEVTWGSADGISP